MKNLLENLGHEYDVFVRRFGRTCFKIKAKITGNSRPSSYPYISGDSFRKLADYIYEAGLSFDPKTVKKGDIVFVCQEMLTDYFTKIHPSIESKYILICHNGDVTLDESIVKYVDDKVAHFFAQDLTVAHERITPIPIGIENLHFYIAGVVPFFNKLRKELKNKPQQRKNRIFFNFSISTNPPERGPAREYFLTHPLMDTATRFMTPRRHSRVLSTYKFVASPPGHAIESCRTWEALYFGTVPIVKDFVAMRHFKSLGLPLWIVQDWKELEGLTESDLEKKYQEFVEQADLKALFMDFWIEEIKKQQTLLRN